MNQYQAQAHTFHPFGFNVTAIERGAKKPIGEWQVWETTRQTLDDVNAMPWLQAAGVGIISGIGGYHGFDFDKCPDFRAGAQPCCKYWSFPPLTGGSGAPAPAMAGGWPCCASMNFPPAFSPRTVRDRAFTRLLAWASIIIELRWERCQTVLPPSKHPTGPGYCWHTGAPTDRPATVTAARSWQRFRR